MWWIQTHVHFSSSSTLLSNHATLCIAHQSQHPVSYNLFNFVSSYYEWQHTRKSRWQLVVWNLSFPYLLHDLYACFLDSYSDDKLNRDNAKGLNSSRSFWRWVLFFVHTLANYDTLINHLLFVSSTFYCDDNMRCKSVTGMTKGNGEQGQWRGMGPNNTCHLGHQVSSLNLFGFSLCLSKLWKSRTAGYGNKHMIQDYVLKERSSSYLILS